MFCIIQLIFLLAISLIYAETAEYSSFTRDKQRETEFAGNRISFGINVNHVRKCCSISENVRKRKNGTLECVPHSVTVSENSQVVNYERFVTTVGFPECDYRVLSNENYRWFRRSNYSSAVEVGLVYLFYPVWLEVKDNFCIDTNADFNFTKLDEPMEKREVIAFCRLEGMRDYFTHVGINLFILLGSALFNTGTIAIYILARKVHHSRDWLQFTIFVTELSAHASYTTLIITNTYVLLWEDSLKYVTYSVYYSTYYMYTVKFAVMIATSVDLFLCVWRPHLGSDALARTKRNFKGIILCFILPALGPGLANLYNLTMSDDNNYMDSNKRLLDGVPKLYLLFNNLVYFVQFSINITIAVATAILIYRRRNGVKTSDDKKAQKKILKSFFLYIKLICATEMPFFISFLLIHAQLLGSPSSIWSTSLRTTYLISAIYVFVVFGWSKKHRNYIRKVYSPNSSTK